MTDDPKIKALLDGIPEADRKALWHALGETLHGKGGVHTNADDDDSGGGGGTKNPPPPKP